MDKAVLHSTPSRRAVLRGAAVASLATTAAAVTSAALPQAAIAEAAPIAPALADGPLLLKGWSICYLEHWRNNPLTVHLADDTYRLATDEEILRYLLRHPLQSEHFAPERLRQVLPVEFDGPLFALLAELHQLRPANPDDSPQKKARIRWKRQQLLDAISAYRARTDAGAAQQLYLVSRATYGHEDDALTEEQKRGLINSAISWLFTGLCNDRKMESRARVESHADVPERHLADEAIADAAH